MSTTHLSKPLPSKLPPIPREIGQRLQNMSKQELIRFMVEKGNESKRAQYEATLTFTQEAQSGVGHLIDSLEQRIQEKQSKLELIDQQKKNF